MSFSKRKPKKESLTYIIDKYTHDNEACINFFLILNFHLVSIVINVVLLIIFLFNLVMFTNELIAVISIIYYQVLFFNQTNYLYSN